MWLPPRPTNSAAMNRGLAALGPCWRSLKWYDENDEPSVTQPNMPTHNFKRRAEQLLTLARKLAEAPGLTWVEANNSVYGPGGPFVRLFPTAADRAAFSKTAASRQIDALIDRLPEPPIIPQPREYS
jgi:hypothetical protein